jgi:hypothetical protein
MRSLFCTLGRSHQCQLVCGRDGSVCKQAFVTTRLFANQSWSAYYDGRTPRNPSSNPMLPSCLLTKPPARATEPKTLIPFSVVDKKSKLIALIGDPPTIECLENCCSPWAMDGRSSKVVIGTIAATAPSRRKTGASLGSSHQG